MLRSSFISQLAYALARQNGFYRDGSIAKQSNNPGLLKRFRRLKLNEYGVIEFDSPKTGFMALENQIKKSIERNRTITEICLGERDSVRYIMRYLEEHGIHVTSQIGTKDLLDNVQLYRESSRVHSGN